MPGSPPRWSACPCSSPWWPCSTRGERDGVGLDVRAAPLGSHGPREVAQAAFGGGVGGDGRAGQVGLDRTEIDDLASVAFDHPAGHGPADDERAGEVVL